MFDSLALSLRHKMDVGSSPLSLWEVQLKLRSARLFSDTWNQNFLCQIVLFCIRVSEIMLDGAVTAAVPEQTAAWLTAHRLTRISDTGLQLHVHIAAGCIVPCTSFARRARFTGFSAGIPTAQPVREERNSVWKLLKVTGASCAEQRCPWPPSVA